MQAANWKQAKHSAVSVAHAGDDFGDEIYTVDDLALVLDAGEDEPPMVLEGSADELVALWAAITVALAMEGIKLPLPENLSAF